MDRGKSRSMPYLPRYQSPSPARSPLIGRRSLVSLRSVSQPSERIYYIDSVPTRVISSYPARHSPSPKRTYKVHLFHPQTNRLLTRTTRSLSVYDMNSSHVYTSQDDLYDKSIRDAMARRAGSCEDIYHKAPFFPDITPPESGVSFGESEEGSTFDGDDDNISQQSFGSSSAFNEVTVDSELDRCDSDNFSGTDCFGDRVLGVLYEGDIDEKNGKRKRGLLKSGREQENANHTLTSTLTYGESRKKELILNSWDFDKLQTRTQALKVLIPGSEASSKSSGKSSTEGEKKLSSTPLAQSTPHVSPRSFNETGLRATQSWNADGGTAADDGFSEVLRPKTARSLFNVDGESRNSSRIEDSSCNSSCSEDNFSDVSSATISSPVPRKTKLVKKHSDKSVSVKTSTLTHLHNQEDFQKSEKSLERASQKHYKSTPDLFSKDYFDNIISNELSVLGSDGEQVGRSRRGDDWWAVYGGGKDGEHELGLRPGRLFNERTTKALNVNIPLISAGKRGQERLRQLSQTSPPPTAQSLDRSPFFHRTPPRSPDASPTMTPRTSPPRKTRSQDRSPTLSPRTPPRSPEPSPSLPLTTSPSTTRSSNGSPKMCPRVPARPRDASSRETGDQKPEKKNETEVYHSGERSMHLLEELVNFDCHENRQHLENDWNHTKPRGSLQMILDFSTVSDVTVESGQMVQDLSAETEPSYRKEDNHFQTPSQPSEDEKRCIRFDESLNDPVQVKEIQSDKIEGKTSACHSLQMLYNPSIASDVATESDVCSQKGEEIISEEKYSQKVPQTCEHEMKSIRLGESCSSNSSVKGTQPDSVEEKASEELKLDSFPLQQQEPIESETVLAADKVISKQEVKLFTTQHNMPLHDEVDSRGGVLSESLGTVSVHTAETDVLQQSQTDSCVCAPSSAYVDLDILKSEGKVLTERVLSGNNVSICISGVSESDRKQSEDILLREPVGSEEDIAHQVMRSEDENIGCGIMRCEDQNMEFGIMRCEDQNMEFGIMRSEDENIEHATVRSEENNIIHSTIKSEDDNIIRPTIRFEDDNIIHPTIRSEDDNIHPTIRSEETNVIHPTIRSEDDNIHPTIRSEETNIIHSTIRSEETNIIHPTIRSEETNIIHPTIRSEETNSIHPTIRSEETNIIHPTIRSEETNIIHPTIRSEETNIIHPTIRSEETNIIHPKIRSEETNIIHPTIRSEETNIIHPTIRSEETNIIHPTIRSEETNIHPTIRSEETNIIHPTIRSEEIIRPTITSEDISQPVKAYEENITKHQTVSDIKLRSENISSHDSSEDAIYMHPLYVFRPGNSSNCDLVDNNKNRSPLFAEYKLKTETMHGENQQRQKHGPNMCLQNTSSFDAVESTNCERIIDSHGEALSCMSSQAHCLTVPGMSASVNVSFKRTESVKVGDGDKGYTFVLPSIHAIRGVSQQHVTGSELSSCELIQAYAQVDENNVIENSMQQVFLNNFSENMDNSGTIHFIHMDSDKICDAVRQQEFSSSDFDCGIARPVVVKSIQTVGDDVECVRPEIRREKYFCTEKGLGFVERSEEFIYCPSLRDTAVLIHGIKNKCVERSGCVAEKVSNTESSLDHSFLGLSAETDAVLAPVKTDRSGIDLSATEDNDKNLTTTSSDSSVSDGGMVSSDKSYLKSDTFSRSLPEPSATTEVRLSPDIVHVTDGSLSVETTGVVSLTQPVSVSRLVGHTMKDNDNISHGVVDHEGLVRQHHSLYNDGYDVIKHEGHVVSRANSLITADPLDNLHTQLSLISRDQACSSQNTAERVNLYQDSAEATSVLKEIVRGDSSNFTHISDSSGVSSMSDPTSSLQTAREQYDNDYDYVTTSLPKGAKFLTRPHHHSQLLKFGHLKSGSLWTLQEEADGVIDPASPKPSPKRSHSILTSQEQTTDQSSVVISPLKTSAQESESSDFEESEGYCSSVSTSENDNHRSSILEGQHSSLTESDTDKIIYQNSLHSEPRSALNEHISRSQLRSSSYYDDRSTNSEDSANTKSAETSRVISSESMKSLDGISTLDKLFASLEQFNTPNYNDGDWNTLELSEEAPVLYSREEDFTGILSSLSLTEDNANEVSCSLQIDDSEHSQTTDCTSPVPSDFSENATYTCTGTAQVKKFSFPDHDITDITSKTLLKPVQKVTAENQETTSHTHKFDQFEMILNELNKGNTISDFVFVNHKRAGSTSDCEDLYWSFTNDDSEKKQNHVCIVVEDEGMNAFRFKRFLKKSHTKRKKGKKVLRFLSKLGCVSETIRSPVDSPYRRAKLSHRDSWSFNTDSMPSPKHRVSNPVLISSTSFHHHHDLSSSPVRSLGEIITPSSSNQSIDSLPSRTDSAYSSISESVAGSLASPSSHSVYGSLYRTAPISTGSMGSVFDSVSSSCYLSLSDTPSSSDIGRPIRSSLREFSFSQSCQDIGSLDTDVMSALTDVFEQLDVCGDEIDSALLNRLRHGHIPTDKITK